MDDENSLPENDCENGERGDHETSNKSEQKQKISFIDRFWSFAESHLPAPVDENSAAGKIRKHCQEQVKFYLEMAGIIFGVIMVVIISIQTWCIYEQWKVMKQTRIMDERAWVFVSFPNNALNISITNSFVEVIIKNIGKTPAFITSDYANVTNNIFQSHDPIGNKAGFMITPNQECSLIIPITPYGVAGILSNAKVYVFGTVYYSDIFTSNHWSQFCFSFANNGVTMKTENAHSSCDDIETEQNN
jgi:hypothetical protein